MNFLTPFQFYIPSIPLKPGMHLMLEIQIMSLHSWSWRDRKTMKTYINPRKYLLEQKDVTIIINFKIWPCSLPALLDQLHHQLLLDQQPSIVDQKPKLANTIISMSSWAPLNPHEVFTGNLYASSKKNGWFTPTTEGPVGSIDNFFFFSIDNFKGSCLLIIFFMSLGSRDLSAKGKSLSWSHLLLFLMRKFLFYFYFLFFFY